MRDADAAKKVYVEAYHSLGEFHQRSHTGYIRASHWHSDPWDSVTVHNTINISKKNVKACSFFAQLIWHAWHISELQLETQLPLILFNMMSQMGTEADACSLHKSQIKGWLERNLKLFWAQGATHKCIRRQLWSEGVEFLLSYRCSLRTFWSQFA